MNEYIDYNEEWDEEYDEYEEVEVDLSRFPAYPVKPHGVEFGIFITDLLISCGLARDEGESEKLIKSGMICVNDEIIPSVFCILTEEDFWEGYICVTKGEDEGRYIVLDL